MDVSTSTLTKSLSPRLDPYSDAAIEQPYTRGYITVAVDSGIGTGAGVGVATHCVLKLTQTLYSCLLQVIQT